MKNVLFVCSANKQRSKTAEDYFSTIYPDFRFESAGTNLKICRKEGTNPLTEAMLVWADVVFVMEKKHLQLITAHTSNAFAHKIIVLSIPDKYAYYQKELIALLMEKTRDYFTN